jgi:peptidyl-prolyl cis-trans isomerase A (cyclophilin A)
MRTISVLLSLVLAAPALADTSAAADDPVPNHTLPLEEALKPVKGSGQLNAKIDLEHDGKPLGSFTCALYDKQAPKTVANFVGLALGLRPFKDPASGKWIKKPFYNGLGFHRVIPEFMIQGGDPDGNGRGGPGYSFEDEFDPELKMDKGGILAMANRGPATNGSQFFITEKGAPWLTGRHTIFGQCEPVDLVAKVARVPRGPGDRPTAPVTIKKVTITRGKATKK